MPTHRKNRTRVNDKLLIDTIGECIKTNGLHALTIKQIREYIGQAQIPNLKVPGKDTVSMILKEKFLLRHVKYDGSIARYRDPLYNDRRIWLARIMTQLICEDVLIVSIDETHFRSDIAMKKRWQVKSVNDSKRKHKGQGDTKRQRA